jgi:group II intron reverse transcriptase/maturase
VSKGLAGVRAAARKGKKTRFTALLHHVDRQLLRESFYELKRGAAVGVDGLTWKEYEQDLEERIEALWDAVQSGRYRALPTRRVYIPKANGGRRPLGIAALEDKIVQHAVTKVLNAIYEEDFLGFSYGYRPGRNPHMALDAVSVGLERRKVNWVLDADLKAFFDTVEHEWVLKFLQHRIADQRMLRLIRKWLVAGTVEQGVRTQTQVGTPQGAVISPLLANIYLHYVFDLWIHRWRGRDAAGQVVVIRYADDTVIGLESKADAQRLLQALRERLAQFGLSLNEEKTRVVQFGRFAAPQRKAAGLRRPDTFEFLGFTHMCGKTRTHGRFVVQRQTSVTRLRSRLKQLKQVLRQRRHQPVSQTGQWLGQVYRGYTNYHGVPGNLHRLAIFRREAIRLWRQSLRRRSQGQAPSWARMRRLADRYIPPPRIVHPHPHQRLRV